MRKYVLLIAFFAASGMATLFGVMRFMDPFYYYGQRDRTQINAIRFHAVDYPEMAKSYSVEWYRPQSLIMGTSRAQVGLDPTHERFRIQPVYNLAYPGSSMRRTLALFEHAVATGEIKQIILALDFFAFRSGTIDDGEFARLIKLPDHSAPPIMKHWQARIVDFWRVNFSVAAIKLAAYDLLANAGGIRSMAWIMRRDGHNELIEPNGLNYEKIFDAAETSFSKIYSGPDFCLSSQPGGNSLGDLRIFVERARSLKIDLRILISPEHVNIVELIDRSGLWMTWEAWKREIVRMTEEISTSDWSPKVFDFSGYNSITSEPVPIGSPLVEMSNYWDPSHYKRHVGDQMLERALGGEDTNTGPDFGRQISFATIENHLEWIRYGRSAWREYSSSQISRIRGRSTEKQADSLCLD